MDFSFLAAFFFPALFIIGGIVLLIKGGNWTVDSAVFIARKHGIPPIVVGFTILAFGTSLPELLISVLANIEGSPGIALGNVIGSNIANILLVIGVSAIIAPLISKSKAMFRDLLMMVMATGALTFLMQYGYISRWVGLAMICVLVGYIFLQYRLAKQNDDNPAEVDDIVVFRKSIYAYGVLLLGLIAVAGGAKLLVDGARDAAQMIGVPEAVIALSVIALGTSLPELSTCIIAARKRQSEMVLGNVIGSNVFNVLMIIGVTALVKPIVGPSFAVQLVSFDSWVMLAASVIFTMLIIFIAKIGRIAGIVFFGAYCVYNIYIYAIYLHG